MRNHTIFSFYDSIKKRRLPITSDFSIGRLDTTITFPDDNLMSRKHVAVYIIQNQVWIEDLNSTNKTYINGKAIPSNVKTPIKPNDTLEIGRQKLIFTAHKDTYSIYPSFQKTSKNYLKTIGKFGLILLALIIFYYSEIWSILIPPIWRVIILIATSTLIFIVLNSYFKKKWTFPKRAVGFFGVVIPLLLLYVYSMNQRLQVDNINDVLHERGHCPTVIYQMEYKLGEIVSNPYLRYGVILREDSCRMVKISKEFKHTTTKLCLDENYKPTTVCLQRLQRNISDSSPQTALWNILMMGLGSAVLARNFVLLKSNIKDENLLKSEVLNTVYTLMDSLISLIESSEKWLWFKDYIHSDQEKEKYAEIINIEKIVQRMYVRQLFPQLIDMKSAYFSKIESYRSIASPLENHDEKFKNISKRLDDLKIKLNYPDPSLDEDIKLYQKELKKYQVFF